MRAEGRLVYRVGESGNGQGPTGSETGKAEFQGQKQAAFSRGGTATGTQSNRRSALVLLPWLVGL